MEVHSVNTAKQIGPRSKIFRHGVVGAKLDGRTRLGKFKRAVETDLISQLGAPPSAAQRLLINQATQLAVQLKLMDDAAAARGGRMTKGSTIRYLAWSNTLARTLKLLGLKPASGKPSAPSLADYAASKRRGAGGAP